MGTSSLARHVKVRIGHLEFAATHQLPARCGTNRAFQGEKLVHHLFSLTTRTPDGSLNRLNFEPGPGHQRSGRSDWPSPQQRIRHRTGQRPNPQANRLDAARACPLGRFADSLHNRSGQPQLVHRPIVAQQRGRP